jgi:two-component system, OmpR family, sensor histidine kinase MprB
MNLRLRLTLLVSVTFALVVVGCTYAAHVSASRQLRSETDQFLLQRSTRFTHTPPSQFPENGSDGDEGGAGGGPPLADPDAVTQILNAQGRVTSSIAGQPALPIDERDQQLAEQGGHDRFHDVTISNVPYRVLTAAIPGGGAVQIARDVDGDDDVLASLDSRLLLIALAGTIVAASLAWAIARRTVRPIEELTLTATYVAETQDLANSIKIDRRDELGRLASSFNTMLDALHTSREQQKRLVLDASHELRTPLTALRTNIDLLRRAHTFDDAQRAELLT